MALFAVSATGCAQTFDFEEGLQGWSRTGTAFDAQPALAAGMKPQWFTTIKLGGDYWKKTSYPLGQHGRYLLTSGGEQGNSPTGTLVSPQFSLDRSTPNFSFRIGGTRDADNEYLQLEVLAPAASSAALAQQIQAWAQQAPRREGDYLAVARATGNNVEAMRQETTVIPEFLFGLPARIRIVDASAQGHINADYIRFTASSPEPFETPVWGYADYHTHPMSYLAFGNLKMPPVPTLYGRPGGNVEYYRVQDSDFRYQKVTDDISHCPPRHGGGYLAEQFINEAQILPDKLGFSIKAFFFPHGKSGGPQFTNFPSHVMGAHEQMHITQIRRNYDGGLRLMVALATDNLGAEALTSYVVNGHVDLAEEKLSVEKQLEGMQELARLNQEWMQIAYTPEEARQIILENKLAVILGVEVDQLGTYGFPSAEDEVKFLWGLGARAVIPIHAADNRIGGPAIFEPAYNWLNDYLNRKPNPDLGAHLPQDATVEDLVIGPYKGTAFFNVTADPNNCIGADGRPSSVGECVMYRLADLQFRVAVRHPFYTLFRPVAWILPSLVLPYRDSPGHGFKNQKGLSEYGGEYIAALMSQGMILDTAHMSDLSVTQTYAAIGERLRQRRPECAGFGFDRPAPPACDADAYPAIISHAHFRHQAIYDASEPISGFLPSEYDISDKNLEMVRRTGGVVGPFVTEGRVDKSNIDGMVDDCGMSSKDFAFSYHYALSKLGGGVGMATDFTFIPTTVPRFGKDACSGYKPYTHSSQERSRNSKRYNSRDQQLKRENCGVKYAGLTQPKEVSVCGATDALEPYQMDRSRTYNFNLDGLAHYGLVPDMLQDLSDVGLPGSDLDALFSSAEAYLKMWEKVERLADRVPGGAR